MKTDLTCEITKITHLQKGVVDIWLHSPEVAAEAKPGQLVHVHCGDGCLLRRPFAIADVQGDNIRFVVGVKGEGTQYLAARKIGESLNILAPLGQGFNLKKHTGTAYLVGGGIGIFPLLYLAKSLNTPVKTILGFRNKDLIILEDEFSACSDLSIATDDGSYGHHGLVTEVLEKAIAESGSGTVFACGPIPMMKAVKKVAAAHDIPAQLSMEERMGCAIGMCNVCVCKVKGEYAKVCQMGPVFKAEDLFNE